MHGSGLSPKKAGVMFVYGTPKVHMNHRNAKQGNPVYAETTFYLIKVHFKNLLLNIVQF